MKKCQKSVHKKSAEPPHKYWVSALSNKLYEVTTSSSLTVPSA